MLTFDVQVTGVQVGTALQEDEEEMAYMLTSISKMGDGRLKAFADDVCDYIGNEDALQVCKFMQAFIDEMKARM